MKISFNLKFGLVLGGICFFLNSLSLFAQENENNTIEIIAAGQIFNSLAEYKAVNSGENKKNLQVNFLEDKIKQECFSRVYYRSLLGFGPFLQPTTEMWKTLTSLQSRETLPGKASPEIMPEELVPLYQVGFNTGVIKVVEEFQKGSSNFIHYKKLKNNELESMMIRAFDGANYDGPVLIISDKNKVRIMTLEDSNE